MKNLLCIAILAALLTGCASPDKLLERGDYDSLIEMATKRMSGKKKKDEYVLALEKGFDKMIRRDMAAIESLRQSNTAADWEEIIRIACDIDYKQSRVEPFLPLVSETGYQAKFTFVKTNTIITEATAKAIELHEARLTDLVTVARRGNKSSAREAFALIDRIRGLANTTYRPELREEMRNLGINHVLVTIENETHAQLPPRYEDELLTVDLFNQGRDWDRFYTSIDDDEKVDYEVVLRILDIAIGPDELHEKPTHFVKEVKDGWEYVLDERGNVKKDSLGNDIKRDKFTKVNATLIESIQEKKTFVHARMEVVNSHTGTRIFSQPLDVENRFTHTARNFHGDERALDAHLRNRIAPIPYPGELTMLSDAFKAMKPKFFDEVRRYQYNDQR
jgi:hypothetical protein